MGAEPQGGFTPSKTTKRRVSKRRRTTHDSQPQVTTAPPRSKSQPQVTVTVEGSESQPQDTATVDRSESQLTVTFVCIRMSNIRQFNHATNEGGKIDTKPLQYVHVLVQNSDSY